MKMKEKMQELSFDDAKKFVRILGLKSHEEWNEYSKNGNKPHNIPSDPYKTYKNKGWVSWGNFLDNNNVKPVNKKYSQVN